MSVMQADHDLDVVTLQLSSALLHPFLLTALGEEENKHTQQRSEVKEEASYIGREGGEREGERATPMHKEAVKNARQCLTSSHQRLSQNMGNAELDRTTTVACTYLLPIYNNIIIIIIMIHVTSFLYVCT